MKNVPVELKSVLDELKQALGGLYRERLRAVVLYGSWARGEASDDSDIDVAIVLSGATSPGLEIDRMLDIIVDLQLRHDVVISVYPTSEESYRGLTFSSHKAAIVAFSRKHSRPGVFPRERAKGLSRAFQKRQLGDYEHGFVISADEARELPAVGQSFTGRIAEYLGQMPR